MATPIAAPEVPIRAGVEVMDGAAMVGVADDDDAAALALVAMLEAGAIDGGGRFVPGGLMKARGALGGLKLVKVDGEGGIRPPVCVRVAPNEGDRSGVDAPHVVAVGVVVCPVLVVRGLANPSASAIAAVLPIEPVCSAVAGCWETDEARF